MTVCLSFCRYFRMGLTESVFKLKSKKRVTCLKAASFSLSLSSFLSIFQCQDVVALHEIVWQNELEHPWLSVSFTPETLRPPLPMFLGSKLWFRLSIVHLCSVLHTKRTANVSSFWPNDYLGIMFNLFPNPSKWLKICLHNSCQPSEKMKQKKKVDGRLNLNHAYRNLCCVVFCCQICHLSHVAREHFLQADIANIVRIVVTIGCDLVSQFIYHLIQHARTFCYSSEMLNLF